MVKYKTVAINAYKALNMDGLIGVFTTNDLDSYRNQNKENYVKADSGA